MHQEAHKTRWLVLHGPLIFPARLAVILKDIVPVASSTVQVHDAFLSFDVPGVPFLEPAHANVLVKGFNDDGEWSSKTDGEKGLDREGEAYKRWVWARCSPGVDFAGSLPRELEGVAYELAEDDVETVVSRALKFLPSSVPTVLVPVRASRFELGDVTRSLGEVSADIIVAQPETPTAGLQPSRDYHMLILRGAFLNVLSQPYLAQLTILRPMDLSPPAKARTARLYRLLLVPSFLLFYLPSRILGPVWAQLGALLFGRGAPALRALERLSRGTAGSGYWNDLAK
ncbi:hypothetical protein JCM3775_000143 [Rhodotorula graminis]|uniref:Uncharacterized protein n=1 Tax=Rhodotorula graminis (strain WP1) TaxID=578459 RepID=A0A194S6Y3_RHOGW|nr:uncharacterized protein RHOBADRAFT_52329 [Rhodotorula graminis WP1]KPV76304.1 hypothetical protein RHOBADRAFT_52329 [Rhodotorula graminis WP1]